MLSFDFSDAFGSVNRTKLLYKIHKDFGITGKLFLHLHDFLSNRHARIKVGDVTGEWIQSDIGISAGTILRSILFILYVYDAPPDISKFADYFITIDTVKNSPDYDSTAIISSRLQVKVNAVANWASKWDLDINLKKTICILFTKGISKPLHILIGNGAMKQVLQKRYPGIIMDIKLTFPPQVDNAIITATKSLKKVS